MDPGLLCCGVNCPDAGYAEVEVLLHLYEDAAVGVFWGKDFDAEQRRGCYDFLQGGTCVFDQEVWYAKSIGLRLGPEFWLDSDSQFLFKHPEEDDQSFLYSAVATFSHRTLYDHPIYVFTVWVAAGSQIFLNAY